MSICFFRVCPYMLRVLSYAVRKLNTIPEYGKWLGLRFSYGMNGILVRNEDLISLTGYLRYSASAQEQLQGVESTKKRFCLTF